jgi:carbon-monoxide dehydrogenase medium subunit
MYPREFDYMAPASIEDAVAALAANPGAKVLAGGMSLLPLMKMRLFSPEAVIDIGMIPGLDVIEDRGDHIAIGALVRHSETATNSLIVTHARALAEAASWTGDTQVRNRGTTCGSMAHADVAADQPAGAIAMGATMVAVSSGGRREIAAADFFVDTLTSALTPNEILIEMRVPKAAGGEGSAYDKLGRRGGHSDYAVAGAAAWVRRSNGAITNARVGLTGVASKPGLAAASTQAIIGSDGSEAAIAAAADLATEGINVMEDLYGSEDYKAHLARVYVRRALAEALTRAG